MKKYISLLLAALVLCGSLSLAFASPASAAEVEAASDQVSDVPEYRILDSGTYSGWYHIILDQTEWIDPFIPCIVPVYPDGSAIHAFLYDSSFSLLRPGKPFHSLTSETCYFSGVILFDSVLILSCTLFPYDTNSASFDGWFPLYDFSEANNGFYIYFPPDTQIEVGNSMTLIREVADHEFADYEPLPEGFFGEIYTMIKDAFYGCSQITGYQDLIVTTLATSLIVFLFCIPFILVGAIVFGLFFFAFKGWH